jgi:hypothetical protein
VLRDPSLVGLLSFSLVPALLSLSRAALRAWLQLAVERERQATARLAIWCRTAPPPLSSPRKPAAPRRRVRGHHTEGAQ